VVAIDNTRIIAVALNIKGKLKGPPNSTVILGKGIPINETLNYQFPWPGSYNTYHLRNNSQSGTNLCHRAAAEILGKAVLIGVLAGGTVALGINTGIANMGTGAQGAESMRE
jgi:hypothetical protein